MREVASRSDDGEGVIMVKNECRSKRAGGKEKYMKNEEMAPPVLGGDTLHPEVSRKDHGHEIRRQRHDQRRH